METASYRIACDSAPLGTIVLIRHSVIDNRFGVTETVFSPERALILDRMLWKQPNRALHAGSGAPLVQLLVVGVNCSVTKIVSHRGI